ncbi:MAG: hypothetical protein AB1465_02445 [Patescibacteria group bacterium]
MSFFICLMISFCVYVINSIVGLFGYVIPSLNLEKDIEAAETVSSGAIGIFIIVAYLYIKLKEKLRELREELNHSVKKLDLNSGEK